MEAEKKTVTPPAKKTAVKRPEKKAISEHFVPGKTKCRFCKATVAVRHTETTELDDGTVLITRSVKCNGPRRHSYEIDSQIPKW